MKNIFVAFLVLLTACSADSAMTLTEKDAGQTASVRLNQPIDIILKANATTGYSWQYSSDQPNAFQILKEDYLTNDHPKGMVGVGGKSIYQIKPIKQGTLTITARYYRPWEEYNPDTDTELKFNFEIRE